MHNRLNAEADTRIQLSSVKSALKEFCKNVKQCQSSQCRFFSLWKIVTFQKNTLFLLAFNRLLPLFYMISKYFLNVSVLFSNMLNIGGYNDIQALWDTQECLGV